MDKINKIWPKWHTVEPIGRGAFGEVYKVKREEFGETFYSAVKVIGIPNDKQEIQEFINEGQTSGSIRYYYESVAKGLMNEIKVLEELKSAGNVVNIEEFEIQERKEEIGWDVYIRMELLKSLNEYRQGRQMEWEEVEKLGLDICKALEYCERRKIVHRDIKPSNIFVDDYGDFKLGDFGIARQMERTQSMMSQKGTQKYMAPEVWAGNQKSSYNVDIYSLGLVMYQLLNRNRMPFEPLDREYLTYQEKDEAFRKRLRGEEILPPVDAPEGLGKIIVKACEADRNERYQSAHEMYTDLMEWRKEKKESIEKVKKPAPNKIKTKEKINDKKIEWVSEEKETEDTVLLDRKETLDDLKERQELIEREGAKEPKHVQEEEQQNHSGKTLEKREKVTETRHSNKMGITAASFGIIFLFLISSASFLISKYIQEFMEISVLLPQYILGDAGFGFSVSLSIFFMAVGVNMAWLDKKAGIYIFTIASGFVTFLLVGGYCCVPEIYIWLFEQFNFMFYDTPDILPVIGAVIAGTIAYRCSRRFYED